MEIRGDKLSPKSVSSGRTAGGGGAGTATAGRSISDFPPEDGHQFFDLSGFALRTSQFLRVTLGEAEILKMMTALFTLKLINRHR
jgi:hypothetical protein